MTEPVLEVRFGATTHPGLIRAANEDSFLTVPPVFVVADGMYRLYVGCTQASTRTLPPGPLRR